MQTLTIALQDIVPRPPVSFLVVTAVDVERDAILEVMTPLSGRGRILKVPSRESTYFLGQIGKYACSLVLGEAGSDTRKGSALELQAGIDIWSPLAVIAPGIAFGRRFSAQGTEVQVPGDVLVSTQLYPYHHGKLTPHGQEDRGPHPEASVVFIDRIRNSAWTWTTADGQERKPILGPLLTGPYVLNDATARDELFSRFPGAIGGEMEATGVYSASDRRARQWIVVKGVCDWGAEKGDSHQALAARNAAKLVAELLSENGLDAAAFGRDRPSVESPHAAWLSIDFSDQSDLTPALSGASLGPAHVVACPPIREVEDILTGLEEVGAVAVVGPSGSGKSMAAWHAAYRLQKSGWRVFLFVHHLAPSALPSGNVLLVADDIQAYPAPPIAASLATRTRRVLVISTDTVVGFRRTVRIIPENAVAALADRLIDRHAELLPILRTLDHRVGEGSFDIPLEQKIESARRASRLAWQFMFNLGSGHLRLGAALKTLGDVPPRDTVLFAVAARQLATMDRGAESAWLSTVLAHHGIDSESLPQMLDEVDSRISLVSVGTRISTPHPEVADRIITAMFFGPAAKIRRDLYWGLFDDTSLPLGGLAWLAARLPSNGSDAPLGLVDRLLQRCGQSDDRAHAGFLLATLLSRWGLRPERIRFLTLQIGAWISDAAPEHAWGLARLVNELINADRSERLRGDGAPDEAGIGVTADVMGAISPSRLVAWANRLTLEEDGGQAALLERLAAGASAQFRTEVSGLLDTEHFVAAVRAFSPEQLWLAADLIVALHQWDTRLGRQLVREATTGIIGAMRLSVPKAYSATHDVFWRALGFVSHFFREGPVPDDEQRQLTAAIFEGVGAENLAYQLSHAERRDWNSWQSVAALLRHAAPALAAAVGNRVDVARIARSLTDMLESSMYEVDCLVSAALLTEANEPAATLVRSILAPRRQMNWRAALIAPDAAVDVIKAGGTFSMELSGGLPCWQIAETLLAEIGTRDEEAARSLLLANLDQLADALLYRQANGGENALSFLTAAGAFDEALVLDAVRRVDVAQAEKSWRERLQGGEEEQITTRRFLTVAKQAGGAIAALAATLWDKPGSSAESQ